MQATEKELALLKPLLGVITRAVNRRVHIQGGALGVIVHEAITSHMSLSGRTAEICTSIYYKNTPRIVYGLIQTFIQAYLEEERKKEVGREIAAVKAKDLFVSYPIADGFSRIEFRALDNVFSSFDEMVTRRVGINRNPRPGRNR